jgi:pentatricopeptide repeat protein
MAAAGAPANAETGSAVLRAAVALGQLPRAAALAAAQLAAGGGPDSAALSALLGGAARAGEWAAAAQLCGAVALARGASAGAAMYNFLLRESVSAGALEVALDLLTVMRGAGLEVDPAVASALLSEAADGAAGGAAGGAPAAAGAATPPASPRAGGGSPPPPPRKAAAPAPTLDDANTLLESMAAAGDARGAADVLRHMHLAGLEPDAASFSAAIRAAAAAGDGAAAVVLAAEGHAAGALRRYALPPAAAAAAAGAAPPPGAALPNALDLRGAAPAEGAAAALAWLRAVAALRPAGLVVVDRALKLALGEGADAEALRSELEALLAGRPGALLAFVGLSPITVPPEAVAFAGGVLEVQAAAVYKALARAGCEP